MHVLFDVLSDIFRAVVVIAWGSIPRTAHMERELYIYYVSKHHSRGVVLKLLPSGAVLDTSGAGWFEKQPQYVPYDDIDGGKAAAEASIQKPFAEVGFISHTVVKGWLKQKLQGYVEVWTQAPEVQFRHVVLVPIDSIVKEI